MSQNPYAATGTADFGSEMPSEPARMSVLAIISLVCSLICFLPGLPTLGSVIGVFALLGISASKGRVKGVPLAVVGIVLGLLFSVLQVGLAIGVAQGIGQLGRLADPIVAVEDGDETKLRGYLSTQTNQLLTQEDIAGFRAEYTADAGSFVEAPTGIAPVFSAMMELADAMQPPTVAARTGQLAPTPGRFDNGLRAIYVEIVPDEQNSDRNGPAYGNVGVRLADGSIAWLIDPSEIDARLGTATPGADASDAADTDAQPDADSETGSDTHADPADSPGG